MLVFELPFRASLQDAKRNDSLLALHNQPSVVIRYASSERVSEGENCKKIATYSSICETLSVPNFHGAGKSSFDAFVNNSPLSHSDFKTTRTTSPKYFPLIYFSNLSREQDVKRCEIKVVMKMREFVCKVTLYDAS